MNKTQARRLLKLAWYLKTSVPRNRFDMRTMATGDLHKCGTSGCALGWCTVVFPRVFVCASSGYVKFRKAWTHYRGAPICNWFGVTDDEAKHLFSSLTLRTPKQEARVIENFVRSKGWEYA